MYLGIMNEEQSSLLGDSNLPTYDSDLTLRRTHSTSDDKDTKKEKKKKNKNKESKDGDSDDEGVDPHTGLTPAEEEAFLTAAKSKYDMKNHMANERTFFKYLFTGLHVGSIGTLVLNFFPNTDITKIYLVIAIWVIAFAFMFWGLYGYYRRKYLMETGMFKDTQMLNPHMPLIITSIFFGVVLLVVIYAVYVGHRSHPGVKLPDLLKLNPKSHLAGHPAQHGHDSGS
jgi:uncharacterized membrane protein YidH (DUF202 family)